MYHHITYTFHHTDKKENKIFLIYQENSDGSGCEVKYEEGLSNI
jgi:hypothetical protein